MIPSSPCNLRLVPLHNVLQYGVSASRALVVTVADPFTLDLVPGSLHISDVPDKGIYQKNLSFRIKNNSADAAALLMALAMSPLLAFYTDERGNDRVSGSLSHPLTLTIQQQEAGYACSLKGAAILPDPYLSD